MFDALSEKFLTSIQKLRKHARITESNIEETLKEIRFHLLEADVHFKVVKTFTERVKVKALGEEVLKHIHPGQQFIKIVHDELTQLLGGEKAEFNFKVELSNIFLVGLQGTGKTTTAAKLALYIRKRLKKKVGLVSLDVYRPAAMEQLKLLCQQNQFLYFDSNPSQKPGDILKQAQVWAQDHLVEVLLVDTAGRTQINEPLMQELKSLKEQVTPQEILLIVDAMLGQESVEVAKGFHGDLGITGLIMTKVDGDARGGAILSIKEILNVPIHFLGTGEKVSALEVFYPERLASRILDMGDVVSLVEKAQDLLDEKEMIRATQKIQSRHFGLGDFLKQMRMVKKLGGMGTLLQMLPGAQKINKQLKGMKPPDEELKKIEAIICSMTPYERKNHRVLNGSRRLRIAQGSGTEVSDVNKLIKQFEQTQKLMSQMTKMGAGQMMSKMFGR